jgi:Ca-activated chloride channel family protein
MMKNPWPAVFLLFLALNLHAQKEPSPILFIYDASGSMWGQMDGKTKKEIASSVLTSAVNNLPADQNIGLIAYGHRRKGDCDDIQYLVDLSNNAKEKVTNAVNDINPIGKTPLARSANIAIESLKTSGRAATIILITDGIESCDGDLCKVITDARASGIDFKLHIVGFGLKEGEKEPLKCAANAGGGNYYDADNTAGLSSVLTEATTETVDQPGGNFSIYAVKNGEPVDALVKAVNADSRKDVDGVRTYRDTGFIYLPAGKYVIEIKPLENTKISATTITVEMKEGESKHQEISFDSGKLEVTTLNNGEGWDATIKVVHTGTTDYAAGGRTYGRTKELELDPGEYDIVLEALKISGVTTKHTLEKLVVKPNQTTPVRHNFESGIARIGVQTESGQLIDATVNFTEVNSGTNVVGGRTYTSESNNPREFILSPGTYTVKIVTLGAHAGNKDSFSVTIKPGETVEKVLVY